MKSLFFLNYSKTNDALLLNALFLIALLIIGQANPMAIVFAYVFETIIIGVMHIIKLFFVIKYNEPKKGESKFANYFSILFFMIHYGAFVAFQSVIIYTGFAIKDDRFSTSLKLSNFTDIFNLEGFKVVAVSIILTHITMFYYNFYRKKKYNNQEMGAYFAKPYLRIFVQQFLAIIPFFFLYFNDHVGVFAAILLIVMRTYLDYYMSSVSKNPEKIKNIAQRFVSNKPEELPKIEASLKAFLED